MHDELLLEQLREINTSIRDLRTDIRDNYCTKEHASTISGSVEELKKRTHWLYSKVLALTVVVPFLVSSTFNKPNTPPLIKKEIEKTLNLDSDQEE